MPLTINAAVVSHASGREAILVHPRAIDRRAEIIWV
jgi:hypothetical protein